MGAMEVGVLGADAISAPGDGRPASHGRIWYGWLCAFACALALYAVSSSRGPQWQDSGEHILRVMDGALVHRLGLALSHPLHYWLGRAALWIPGIGPAFAVTLVSALGGALAVANVWGGVFSLTRSRASSWLAAGGLCFAHTMWQLSTRAEVYTLTAALFSAECWCLALLTVTRRRHFLWAAVLLNGLGLANHLQALLTTPILAMVAVVCWRQRVVRARDLVVCAVLWIVGSLPYTALVASEMAQGGHLSAVIYSALFGQSYADEVLGFRPALRTLVMGASFVLLNFPNLQLPAFAVGAGTARRLGVPAMFRRAVLAALIIHAVFVLRYDVVDQYTFFLPTYVLIAVLAGLGFARLYGGEGTRARRGWRIASVTLLVLTPVVYAVFPSVARRLEVLNEVARDKPYRDDYVYLFTPWSGFDRSAERMSEHAVELAGTHGLVLVEDSTALCAIEYVIRQIEAEGVRVTRDVLPEEIRGVVRGGGRVVLVPARADAPRTAAPFGAWRRDGDLYVLEAEGG